jgi:hypothetical protein
MSASADLQEKEIQMKQAINPAQAYAYATEVNHEYGEYVKRMYREGLSPDDRPLDWFTVLTPKGSTMDWNVRSTGFNDREGCFAVFQPKPYEFPKVNHLGISYPMPFTWYRWIYEYTEDFADGSGITGGDPEVFALRETTLPSAAVAMTWSKHVHALNKRGGHLDFAVTYLFCPSSPTDVVIEPCGLRENAKEDDESKQRLNEWCAYMWGWRLDLTPVIFPQLT